METPIKITGELTPDPYVCNFHTSEPVLPEWSVTFRAADEAKGSVLPEKLFAVSGITQVALRDSTINLTKNVETPWPQMAPEIGKAIRASFASGQPMVAAEVIEKLNNIPVGELEAEIAELLQEQINPSLASHGGFVKLVKIENRDVYLEMGGGCQGCSSARATLKYGVESALRRAVPQIRNVIDVTNHADGSNPYYK